MMREIGKRLIEELAAKGCRVPVVIDDEQTETVTHGRERIVIAYDDDAGDRFSTARGQRPAQEAKQLMTCTVGSVVTIYAQSTRAGAQPFEHRRRARAIRDAVIGSLWRIIRGDFRNASWVPSSGRFIVPDDLQRTARIGGAVYELRFSVDTGIEDRDWGGVLEPTVEITDGMFQSTTQVELATGGPNETSCGGE